MAQHISVRVPWHDNVWNGTVCHFPGENNACLRLKNIYEKNGIVEGKNLIVTYDDKKGGLDSDNTKHFRSLKKELWDGWKISGYYTLW